MGKSYIKSPLNYVGGKYKLLKEIIPLFPKEIDTFVDLFGGGANVCVNVNANKVIYNDNLEEVVQFLNTLKDNDIDTLLSEIESYINQFNLSKENKTGFLEFRDDYNNGVQTPIKFYTLLCYAFNYQIRFNKSGKYNMPFGKDRSSFNPVLRQKFIEFHRKIQQMNCIFECKSFEDFDFSGLTNKDFVYCDPPYLNSVATYNEQGGWTEREEKKLLDILDELNSRNIRFALSNNLKYENPILENWKKKYNEYFLYADYTNCNYHKKDKRQDFEVLITNYAPCRLDRE